MKSKSNPDEHAKDPRWQLPIDLPSVSPDDYMRQVKHEHGATPETFQTELPISEQHRARSKVRRRV